MKEFLPINREDMKARGWDYVDFAYVIGDAYCDHSSFGHAIISRVLESRGFRVGIISQPDWRSPESVKLFGRPRLGFLVSSGNMDSMVNHYTVNKRRRREDAFSPGGKAGRRPDYALNVYCNLIRQAYGKVPILIGGIEASLRRLAHYDYWSDKLRRSVLLDSGADLLLYGMGERSIVNAAEALNSGLDISDLCFLPGTVYKTRDISNVPDLIELPKFEDLLREPLEYARSFSLQYQNTDPFTARPLAECYGQHRYIVQNPPEMPLSTLEMDDIYELPYTGRSHPSYDEFGGVPAMKEIRFSLSSNRGCFGSCSFCALSFHEGRIVQARSHESLLREAEAMTREPDFKGYIHDVGGPTADFRFPSCEKQLKYGCCRNRQCLFPKPCTSLRCDHEDYLELLRKLRKLPGVKKVFIRSGVRFDYVMADKKHGREFMEELAKYHVSGQLRAAPEHVSDGVLKLMGKPEFAVYESFCAEFERATEKAGKEQFVLPYLISSHPGSTLKDAVLLAEAVRDMGYMPEQVQDFYPTPSTLSTCMYYTGVDPLSMQPVYVARDPEEKKMQRALIQYRKPENAALVRKALRKAGREDLIGRGKNCLVMPEGGIKAGREGRRS